MTAAPLVLSAADPGASRSQPLGQSLRLAVGYVRVSREEQVRNGVSLDVQRARIVAYAEAKDLKLACVYADEGLSGRELHRPGLQQLLEYCRTGLIRHVIVWKLDRLTRQTRHLLGLVEDLFLSKQIELHSVSESLDTGSPHGRFVLTLFGGLAQMEREQIVERTRGALAWKRERGLPTSHAPLGFRSIGKREPMQPIVAELRIVRRILNLRQTGLTYRAIAAVLNAERVPTKRFAHWHHTTIAKVVASRERYRFLVDTSERACPPQGAISLATAEVEGSPKQGGGDSLPQTQSAATPIAAPAYPARSNSPRSYEGRVNGSLSEQRRVPHDNKYKNPKEIESHPSSGSAEAATHRRAAHRE